MAFLAPGVMNVQAFFEDHGGHHGQNSVGYINLDASDPPGLALDISLGLVDAYTDMLSDGSFFNGVRILIGQDGGEPIVGEALTHTVGSRGGEMCPPNVQGLIRKTTALSGRHNRGRLFIPDIEEAHVSGAGNLDSSELGKLAVIAAAWMNLGDNVDGVGATLLLHTEADPQAIQLTTMEAESRVATLRRRYKR